jgi:hypothetical protein
VPGRGYEEYQGDAGQLIKAGSPEKEVYWSEQSWDEMYAPQARITVDSRDLKNK